MIISPLKIFSGSSHPELAKAIADHLTIDLSKTKVSRFASNEIYAKPLDSVRGCDIFVVQTATSQVNDDLMELFILADALRRSGAMKIHVVMPHFAYARQDRVASPRESISAKVVANLMQAAGVDHLITMNLHSDQIQGFFNFPVDNLSSTKLLLNYFQQKKLKNLVVVAPDASAAKSAKNFADLLSADLAILHKQRPAHNVAETTHVVGEVKGKTCLIIDDMIDTAGTVVAGHKALLANGANSDIYLAATHALFSNPAIERLKEANFKEVVVTDSVPVTKQKHFKGLKVLTIAPLLAKIIRNVHEAKSVTEVFNSVS